MHYFFSQLFKRKHRREYLYDEFTPKKSSFTIWVQRLIIFIVFFIILLFVLTFNTLAEASIKNNKTSINMSRVTMEDISHGSLLLKTQTTGEFLQIPLLHSNVNMNISGLVSRTHIKQKFKNSSDNWIEAVYVFPLPETAAVDHLRMYIGDRVINGEIKERAQAKRIYETAKRQGIKTSLIEQERPNLFTNSVANIGPGETIVIEIEYQQVLQYSQGKFSLRFPMAITPRYIPGQPVNESFSVSGDGWAKNTDQVIDASRITPPIEHQKSLADSNYNSVSLTVKLDAGLPIKKIFSRYHSVQQKDTADGNTIITLTNERTVADRDFELVWTPDTGHAPKAALFNEQIADDHYQLLMVLPPENEGYNSQPLAREVTYIIDTSGSMHGISMDQAKNSLIMALDRLRVHDKFNIIQFNSSTDTLFYDAKQANFKNIESARKYVRRLQANGGTEMAPALKLALDKSEDKEYLHQVIFLTDGSVGNESALFELIKNNLGNSRLFTVGIGSAPNSYFMRKAAQFGRGTFTYISDINEVTKKMTALFSKLENPLMTDIKIQLPEHINAEIWPDKIPDLYNGEPLVLAIKTSTPLKNISLTGTRALSPWTANISMSKSQVNNGIGTYWARHKIAALMDRSHNGKNKSEVRSRIIETALKHHLVSKFTSLVAVDKTPSRPLSTSLKKSITPTTPAHGQKNNIATQQVFGSLPQTATSAQMKLLCGFSLLLLGLFSQLIHLPPFKSKLQQWRLL